jgi:CRP/FNR family transcriptional regulator, transcriptional activator FtrB
LRHKNGFDDDEKIALLAKAPIFAGLSPPAIRRIAAIASIEERESPAVLAIESEIPRFLYLLLRGQIGFSARTSDGKSSIVDVINSPEVFPLAACLATLPLLGAIHVLSPARLVRIAALELRALVKTDTEIGMAMIMSLSQLNRSYYASMTDMKIRSAAQRLGSYIFTLAREQGYPSQVRLPMSKQFLASRLGTTPENLSRCFAGLRAHGIETSGSRIQITDAKRLAAFIAPNPDERQ